VRRGRVSYSSYPSLRYVQPERDRGNQEETAADTSAFRLFIVRSCDERNPRKCRGKG